MTLDELKAIHAASEPGNYDYCDVVLHDAFPAIVKRMEMLRNALHMADRRMRGLRILAKTFGVALDDGVDASVCKVVDDALDECDKPLEDGA